ncbi:MAG: glycosyltransferase family 41 protein [Alphaproteobacteria bacterium]|nr:glycosyltransferase family 41 protein [Alphaproteobacteria bacterium]
MARKELNFGQILGQAFTAYQRRDFKEAERCCGVILKAKRNHFDALHLLGIIAGRSGRYDDAARLLGEALRVNTRSAPAHSDLGIALMRLGRAREALDRYDRALSIDPTLADARYNRGNALLALGRFEEAVQSYDQALALRPDSVIALANRGNALRELKRFEEALAGYDQALALRPDHVNALNNRGNVLSDLMRLNEALASYDKALAFKADDAKALANRGNVLKELHRYDEALRSYDQSLAIEPKDAETLCNRGVALMDGRQYELAAADFEAGLRIDPDRPYVLGQLNHCLRHCCDWRPSAEVTERLVQAVRAGKRADFPFSFLAVSDLPFDQRICAETFVHDKFPAGTPSIRPASRPAHDRIRLVYLSSDFREHAISYLTAGLFERHDRARFETFAIALRPEETGEMRVRLKGAFEHFLDVHDKSDAEVARLIGEIEADIVVDLNGHTDGGRTAVLAVRPAPIQVSYIGLAGTMGAPFIDYLIADPVLVGPGEERDYVEKVVRLPEAYLVNDDRRPIAERTPTRAEAGLPESGFVFCSFNNAHKITPEVFAVWMRLLGRIEGSVLWLLSGNPAGVRNLKREAEAAGVDPARLVFAPRARPADHLARHRLADLFLDTLPYNAHTTASDALWTGLPLVTCKGSTFAGRVAASLLTAVGLPELVTLSLADYEALALKLATEPAMLAAVRAKLARNRDTHSLFDTARSTRHLESAFISMVERHRRGEAPAGFDVRPLPSTVPPEDAAR